MNTKQLKVALLGAGAIAEHHLKAIEATEGFVNGAIVDIDRSKAEVIAAKYGIRAYVDYKEMFEQEKPDVAAIALPHFLHLETALYAAERGCHLMLEKPMALSTEECDRIIEAGRKHDIRILIGHTQHYMAENRLAKQILDSGELGELVMIHDVRHANYFQQSRPEWFLTKEMSGGGILANLGAHSIDKIQWLTGSAVHKVKASVSRHGQRGNVEGSGAVYLELENGIPATIMQSGYLGTARNETEILCTKGMLRLHTGNSLWMSKGGPYEQLEVPHNQDAFELQYEDLLAAIHSHSETACTPEYGRGVIAALEAVYRSAESGTEELVAEG
ncbi:Gfo/Idh/MocA family oxidoreductase [Paenibacillus sp. HB172176]|uniref:Gfo/Idh/MocA family protein n=1 Tax=Paenibacillus sp. HB172176 TaxID=2493690 RepID=UPI00143BFB39|nr:Gfo/Idh/MocA family oxidoreductase [Paenibacillus sp. HB172176]